MNYRRYYPQGSSNKYVISDEQFEDMVEDIGFEAALDRDNAQVEMIPENDEEMKQAFFDSCERVANDPRFYLDNLDKIPTFNVKISEIFKRKKF